MEPHNDETKTENNNYENNDFDNTICKTTDLENVEKDPVSDLTESPAATVSCLIPTEGIRRSHTSIEGQFKCAVSSDRLNQLKKIVETAIKEHKTFTIKGRKFNFNVMISSRNNKKFLI